jgi:hypothetical protein
VGIAANGFTVAIWCAVVVVVNHFAVDVMADGYQEAGCRTMNVEGDALDKLSLILTVTGIIGAVTGVASCGLAESSARRHNAKLVFSRRSTASFESDHKGVEMKQVKGGVSADGVDLAAEDEDAAENPLSPSCMCLEFVVYAFLANAVILSVVFFVGGGVLVHLSEKQATYAMLHDELYVRAKRAQRRARRPTKTVEAIKAAAEAGCRRARVDTSEASKKNKGLLLSISRGRARAKRARRRRVLLLLLLFCGTISGCRGAPQTPPAAGSAAHVLGRTCARPHICSAAHAPSPPPPTNALACCFARRYSKWALHDTSAPVLLGEFGTSNSDNDWWREMMRFIEEHDLTYAYWPWNGERWYANAEEDNGGSFGGEGYGLVRSDLLIVSHLSPTTNSRLLQVANDWVTIKDEVQMSDLAELAAREL